MIYPLYNLTLNPLFYKLLKINVDFDCNKDNHYPIFLLKKNYDIHKNLNNEQAAISVYVFGK